ncbi:hypothetical protein [Spirosoma litoris]
MPMNPEDYHPKWELISYLIRVVRAKNRCEDCGAKNHAIIRRGEKGEFKYATACELMRVQILREVYGWRLWRSLKYLGLTKVILTVAHLDRDRANNRFWNLRAKCQRCHLGYDMPQHTRNRNYGRHHDREHQMTVF